jgi:hypothetical protein
MSKPSTLARAELEQLDEFYREGGLWTMESPHVHYDEPICPHAGCGHSLEWIDFKLELDGDPEGVYKPLVRSWWNGTGFAGHCPGCSGLILFKTLRMSICDDETGARLPRLPANWADLAQFA